jgi:ribosomal protein L31
MRSGTSDEAGKPCVYHKACFKCNTCNTQLDTTSCAPDRTVLYCISHYVCTFITSMCHPPIHSLLIFDGIGP